MDKTKARDRGLTVALIILGLIAAVLYVAHGYLRRPLGEELSALILVVLWLAATGLIFPVRDAYANWEARRFCSRHGHDLKNETTADGRMYVICNRCFSVLINQQETKN